MGELLAIAGHDEEGVVGGGADDEDAQDALALPRDRQQTAAGQLVHHDAGRGEAEHRSEQHGERQERAAVDEHEDHEHDHEGHQQQDAVDAGERGGEVGDVGGRSGERGREAVATEFGRRVCAQGVDHGAEDGGLAHLLAHLVGGERDRDQDRLAVVGGDEGGRLRGHDVAHGEAVAEVDGGQALNEGAERGELIRADAVGAGEDEEEGQAVGVGERCGLRAGDARLRFRRQEGGGVVLLKTGELADPGAAHTGQAEPRHDEPEGEDAHPGGQGGASGAGGSQAAHRRPIFR